ncbi:MAG: hypothetical protein Q8Q31_02955 [Nanoarchaeota archaeon]|nr:hypothetical protein [Nanoarchaeota archaeon]
MQKRGLIGILVLIIILVVALLIGSYFIFKNKLVKIDIFKDKEKEASNISDEIIVDIGSEGSCSSSSDCIPASCCHATSCTNKEKAPICDKILCTQQCVPGTLDCGQASCECIDNKCEVVINSNEEI